MSVDSPESLSAISKPSTVDSVYRQRFSSGAGIVQETDVLAMEEPLQISLQWCDPKSGKEVCQEWSVTMRTPGEDIDLVTGLLLSQQVITHVSQISAVYLADNQTRNAENHIVVTLRRGIVPDMEIMSRRHASHSSCGVCGHTSMRSLILRRHPEVSGETNWLSYNEVLALPALLAASQPLFKSTGAVHGAGYFAAGKLLAVAEDVGRHNAVDKLVGHLLQHHLWQPRGVLVLSGRISFELMQKAVMAEIPVVVAVGAPTKLAVDMARQFDLTLIGFTRKNQFNIYHGQGRLLKNTEKQVKR